MTRKELRIMSVEILQSICRDFKINYTNIKINIKKLDKSIHGQFAWNEKSKQIILNSKLLNKNNFKNKYIYKITIENTIIHEVLHYLQYRLGYEVDHDCWFNSQYYKRIKYLPF